MGFLDKVKTQAATATAIAKDAAQKGQARLDSLQAKRAADALLRDLGAVVYGQHMGRAGAGTDADAEQLIGRLQAHEQEHGLIDLASETDDPGGAAASSVPSGGAAGEPSDGAAPGEAPPPPMGQHI